MNNISYIAPRLLLTEAQFCAQVGQSAPGVAIEYHRGFLAIDTLRAGSPLSEVDRRELARLRRRAFWAAEKKLVHLVQRRLGSDRFAYLAITRRHPKSVQSALLTLLAQDQETNALTNPNISLRRACA